MTKPLLVAYLLSIYTSHSYVLSSDFYLGVSYRSKFSTFFLRQEFFCDGLSILILDKTLSPFVFLLSQNPSCTGRHSLPRFDRSFCSWSFPGDLNGSGETTGVVFVKVIFPLPLKTDTTHSPYWSTRDSVRKLMKEERFPWWAEGDETWRRLKGLNGLQSWLQDLDVPDVYEGRRILMRRWKSILLCKRYGWCSVL